MSNDLIVLVHAGGATRAWWSRWGAGSVERDLLQGEVGFTGYVETLVPLDPPQLVAWLCGLVVIDHDARALRLWIEQSPLWREAFHALVAVRWPGWSVAALVDLRDLPGAQVRAIAARGIEDVRAEVAAAWASAASPEVEAWRAEVGDRLVRTALEWQHDLWLTVRDADGRLRQDAWPASYHPRGAPLTIGRAGIEAILAERPGTAVEPWYDRFEVGAHVDDATRTLSIWRAFPSYPDDLLGAIAAAWPGWTIALWPGPGDQLRALGLAEALRWGPETRTQLADKLARLAGHRETGAEIMAKVVGALELAPGQQLIIADPGDVRGPDELGFDELTAVFARWCAARAP
jgi:hypothetical protein